MPDDVRDLGDTRRNGNGARKDPIDPGTLGVSGKETRIGEEGGHGLKTSLQRRERG
jgi:hypothetical protein